MYCTGSIKLLLLVLNHCTAQSLQLLKPSVSVQGQRVCVQYVYSGGVERFLNIVNIDFFNLNPYALEPLQSGLLVNFFACKMSLDHCTMFEDWFLPLDVCSRGGSLFLQNGNDKFHQLFLGPSEQCVYLIESCPRASNERCLVSRKFPIRVFISSIIYNHGVFHRAHIKYI